MGTKLPLPKKEHSSHPHFSAHVYCGQTTGWIKMPLGTEEGLGTGHIVLDWDAALPAPKQGTDTVPNFPPMSVGQTAGRIKVPLGTDVCLGPGDIVLDGGPSSTLKGTQHPTFRPMSIVAKRSPISATAELLYLRVRNMTQRRNGSDVKTQWYQQCNEYINKPSWKNALLDGRRDGDSTRSHTTRLDGPST